MGMLSRISSGHTITKELKRKALHIGVGMTALAFPFFLDSTWEVIVALGTALAWLLAVRFVPTLRHHFGSVLHGVRRRSLGEVYFAIAIAALLLLTQGSPVFFVIPVLILTLADASAAIAGKLYPVGRLSGFARGKTVIGCSVFFTVAILVSFASLTFLTDLNLRDVFLLATVLAGATCVVEAVSRRGLDNLAIPAVAYLVLVIVYPGGHSKHLFSNPLMVVLQ